MKNFTAAAHCGQSLVKSAVVGSVEDVSPRPRRRLDLTATLPHTASADQDRRGSETVSLAVTHIVALMRNMRKAGFLIQY